MKRIVIIASLVLMAVTETNANTVVNNPVIQKNVTLIQYNPVEGYTFCGRIGGDDYCTLQMPSGRYMGYYTFLNYERNVKFGSWNSRSNTLVMNAYEKGSGKYIGKFVGKITYSYGCPRYTGTFTNYKGGKVSFKLDAICD